ncbi:3-ketoacyl-ACP reductase [Piscinibacter terrae]|uniref:3-ketoacyl-ACP reductase n=1 Tax=Piscinibacter terrae TaxID=2496871 RepID=A0A3N7ISE5_9BURK|nr:3-ketoacyl-ACP reductase [Albitalea terrae]RQP21772.1 3-ketoacyl-ACP reductase [Albitalea terrae]
MTRSTKGLALVTGGARGIGAAIACELAGAGFSVGILDILHPEGEALAAQLSADGHSARFFHADLGAIEHHAQVLDAAVAWGGPVVTLVNNAGIPASARGDMLAVTPEAFDRVMDINLRGTFFLSQAVAARMGTDASKDGPRSIVIVSSVSAELASLERAEYCISKSALAMMAKLFALRLAPQGIAVYELRPGIIRTPMTEGVARKYDEAIANGLVPMARWGTPADVAQAVGVLASGSMSFATGSVIHMDGGLSIGKL